MDKPYMNRFEMRGFERGREGERLDLVKLMLRVKFKSIPKRYKEKLEEADSKKLLRWAKRIVQKNTLEEIFSD